MKAILLSAGQGRRLLPLTRELPKCLLAVQDQLPVLEIQLRALARCGVRDVTVMVGFGAEQVEHHLRSRMGPALEVRTRFNPFYATSDNLVTAWLATPEMTGDFVLLNGDTLFEPRVLDRLLEVPAEPAALAVVRKALYDDDDMKVRLDAEGCLSAIGKQLGPVPPDGEAIGMSVFRGSGVGALRDALESAVRRPDALRQWYTSVLHDLAAKVPLRAISVQGLWWTEIDERADLDEARAALRARRDEPSAAVHRGRSLAR